MAYIQPTSEVWLCSNVPLDPSYDNTLTFTTTVNNRKVWDSAAQRAYFASKAVYHPQNFSIVKERDGVLRMSGEVSKFYNINYMFFINPTFETSQLYSGKYFYAFVTQVEEVNPNTTFIYFELDYYQTWAAEIEFMESVIEREHVSDDSMYKNLEDEGINIQDTMPYEKVYLDKVLGDKILVVGATESYQQMLENVATQGWDIFYDPWDVHYPLLNTVGTTGLNPQPSANDVWVGINVFKEITNLKCYYNGNIVGYTSFTYDTVEKKFHILGLQNPVLDKITFTLTADNTEKVLNKWPDKWFVVGVSSGGGDWTFGIDGIRIDYDPWTNYPLKYADLKLNYSLIVSYVALNGSGVPFMKYDMFNYPFVGNSNRIILSDVNLTSGNKQINEVYFNVTMAKESLEMYKVKGIYSGGSWTFTDGS